MRLGNVVDCLVRTAVSLNVHAHSPIHELLLASARSSCTVVDGSSQHIDLTNVQDALSGYVDIPA
jgi:hypothetical protein